MRTRKEALIDRVLLLYAISQVNKYGAMKGNFKLMKLPFLSQRALNSKGIKGFSYGFYREKYGPFTTEIYDDANALEKAGYLTRVGNRGPIYLTDEGEEFLAGLESLFQENELIQGELDRIAKHCAPLSFNELKELVYAKKVRFGDTRVTIRELPQGAPVIGKLKEEECRSKFEIEEDWLDTIDEALSLTAEERDKLEIVFEVA